jgi:hypothetical protein
VYCTPYYCLRIGVVSTWQAAKQIKSHNDDDDDDDDDPTMLQLLQIIKKEFTSVTMS